MTAEPIEAAPDPWAGWDLADDDPEDLAEGRHHVNAQFPHWRAWKGVRLYYARRPRSSPPKVLRAESPTLLLREIGRAEGDRWVWADGARPLPRRTDG